jgi:hypothetical protein
MTIFNDLRDFDRFERKVKPFMSIGFIIASYLLFHKIAKQVEQESYEWHQAKYECKADTTFTNTPKQNLENGILYEDVLSRRLENMRRTILSDITYC